LPIIEFGQRPGLGDRHLPSIRQLAAMVNSALQGSTRFDCIAAWD